MFTLPETQTHPRITSTLSHPHTQRQALYGLPLKQQERYLHLQSLLALPITRDFTSQPSPLLHPLIVPTEQTSVELEKTTLSAASTQSTTTSSSSAAAAVAAVVAVAASSPVPSSLGVSPAAASTSSSDSGAASLKQSESKSHTHPLTADTSNLHSSTNTATETTSITTLITSTTTTTTTTTATTLSSSAAPLESLQSVIQQSHQLVQQSLIQSSATRSHLHSEQHLLLVQLLHSLQTHCQGLKMDAQNWSLLESNLHTALELISKIKLNNVTMETQPLSGEEEKKHSPEVNEEKKNDQSVDAPLPSSASSASVVASPSKDNTQDSSAMRVASTNNTLSEIPQPPNNIETLVITKEIKERLELLDDLASYISSKKPVPVSTKSSSNFLTKLTSSFVATDKPSQGQPASGESSVSNAASSLSASRVESEYVFTSSELQSFIAQLYVIRTEHIKLLQHELFFTKLIKSNALQLAQLQQDLREKMLVLENQLVQCIQTQNVVPALTSTSSTPAVATSNDTASVSASDTPVESSAAYQKLMAEKQYGEKLIHELQRKLKEEKILRLNKEKELEKNLQKWNALKDTIKLAQEKKQKQLAQTAAQNPPAEE